VDDFAAEWLNLRRVGEVVVDPDRYPNYDESLPQAFKRETELFVAGSLREDGAQNRARRSGHQYRWSAIILWIVESPAFLMRASRVAAN
jgi:hypothetical protein